MTTSTAADAALPDAAGLLALADDWAGQQRWSAASLCVLRAMQLGTPGLARRFTSWHGAALAARALPPARAGAAHGGGGEVVVSVVMPTRGVGAGLQTSIASVLAQRFQAWELVVVNDGGPDEPMRSLLAGLADRRIVYVPCHSNGGPSAARNAGIRQARGRLIAYLDDDDVFDPGHLQLAVNALRSQGGELAVTRCHRVYGQWLDQRFIEQRREPQYWPGAAPSLADLLASNFICTLNVVHTRRCLDAVGGWDPGLRHLEDWDLWTRIAGRFGFVAVDSFSGDYRIVADAAHSGNASVRQKSQMVLFEALLRSALQDGQGLHRVLDELVADGDRAAATQVCQWLCAQAASRALPPLPVARQQLAALRRAARAGLDVAALPAALRRLQVTVARLQMAALQQHLAQAFQRHLLWRFSRS